ncbi:7-carboxy-7-deazaguanine synthase QueE [Novipirellula artificiosorum]|uniref:7-carboxy-7-deazaguanine synthase n=1 Tax=Novipirellula artificiosorum TaxID=2528016 RepID=A0A5C6DCB5_9BACT|nr:7-carboxy-7-deazaguanine synthase QueE [Novipirellula artificiosorum]TWU32579.1 7-carboxy-7-deazaguanine synthase [Novipirellula artificiosorum]
MLTGTPSFFIRTSGCNLRCWFCDTPYASWNPEGERRSVESLVQEAAEVGLEHVVFTGGEPLLHPESVDLSVALRASGHHVTIETAGTIDREVECDLLSISPKFRSSAPDAIKHARWSERHEQRRMPIEVMRRLIERSEDFQLKFVVDCEEDQNELLEVVESLQAAAEKVWVMPQGMAVHEIDESAAWLRPWTQSRGFHYCDRMHIRWYGNRRGT